MVEAADATAMVAYMKRYDPAYEQAVTAIDDLESIDLVTAYDVDPDHQRIVEEVYDLVGGARPRSSSRRASPSDRTTSSGPSAPTTTCSSTPTASSSSTSVTT